MQRKNEKREGAVSEEKHVDKRKRKREERRRKTENVWIKKREERGR